MKPFHYLLILLVSATTLSAQKVDLKKGIVYVDETPAFSFEKKAMGNEIHLYRLNTKDELAYVAVETNNTESKVDDSKKVVFMQQHVTIKSKDFRAKNYETMIQLLLEGKVMDSKGEINAENLKKFQQKFDDGNINHINKY